MTTFKSNIICCAWPKKIMLTTIKFHNSDKDNYTMAFQDNKLSYKEFCVMMNKKRNSDAKRERR